MPSGDLTLRKVEGSGCSAVRAGMDAYLDEAADSVLRTEVESHVRTCTDCARELERLRRLIADLRALVVVEPPAHLWEKVQTVTGRPTGAAGAAATGTAAAHAGARLGRLLPRLLLALYDSDLADQLAATGTCRERAAAPHGALAVAAGLAALLPALVSGQGLSIAAGVAALPLLWLASTRLESRMSARALLATLSVGGASAVCTAEALRPGTALLHLAFFPAGALAALAVAQALTAPRLRPRVLALGRIGIAVRSFAVILLCGLLARPDLLGAATALPIAVGAAGGAIAAHAALRMRRAA